MRSRFQKSASEFRRVSPPSPARLSVLGAASSGALQALAFPQFNLLPLGAVALLPLLIHTARETSSWRRFLGGFLAGIVFFATTCSWLYSVQRQYGGLSALEAGGVLLLLVLVLSLYWGVFGWLAGYCWKTSWGPAAVPFLWVALEYARTYVLTGFPWLLTGYLLTDFYPLARLARATGVYGLSYLLVALPVAVLWPFLKPSKIATLHLTAVLVWTGALALAPAEIRVTENQTAYLVQTNVPQQVAFERWDEKTQAPLLERLAQLTLQNVPEQHPPGLVIWPEMPAHFYFHEDGFTRPYAERLARQTNSLFLMGIVAFVPGTNREQALNSSVLLSPGGALISQYDKLHLVPFGEYVPWRQRLGFAKSLTAEVSDFTAGQRYVVSPIPGGQAGDGQARDNKLATFICYEAIFPDQVRRFVKDGAGVLVNISNDGWFGDSAARDQHLLMARMRAIENARYVLRATNTGLTAVIGLDGKISAALPPDQAGVLQARWAHRTGQTIYTQHGDVFAWAASALALLACAAGLLRRGEQDGAAGGKKSGKKKRK